VARDRQRAKQRRAKRQTGSGGAARSTRDVERELGLSGDEVVDSPLGEGTAAPDPLDHASAEVDQARIAEAGPAIPAEPEPEDEPLEQDVYADEPEDDLERAPDEAEGDAPVRRAGVATEPAPPRDRNRVVTFLGHCVDELRRVQWPDRRHVGQATAVVLGFVVLAGGYLGLLDAIWRPLVEAIL
jgi:preprotein translocase subunit SecE